MSRRNQRPSPGTNWLDSAEANQSPNAGFRARRALRLVGRELDEESEVDRTSSAYVSWLQNALNRILNARLVVDGDLGPNTLAAVQAFQRSRGLSADGVVGPVTEAALTAAGAGTPPGSSATPAPAPSGGTSGKLKDNPKYAAAPLAPTSPIAISSSWPKARRDLATTFNRLGGLMQVLALDLGVDVASVLAVWLVESGTYPHVPGKAVIRFETHKFFEYWGKYNESTFDSYFKFGSRHGSAKPWENQQFRTSTSGAWTTLHTSTAGQAQEYAALQHAMKLGGDTPAIKSISLGGCQILGSNYALIGYASPRAMYDAFQGSERWHVLGFFDFCRANNILTHLASQRWTDFAYVYNGSGQAASYGGLIAAARAEAVKLSFPPAPTVPRSGSPPAGTGSPPAGSGSGSSGPKPVVTVNSGVVVSPNAIRILEDLLRAAGLRSATITSGRRDAATQARVMYDLIERNGVSYAKNLYGSYGDQVIDVYAAGKSARQSADSIKANMRSKIIALGPTNVSLHCSETRDIIDVAPSSISNLDAFRRALDAALSAGTISRYIPPPTDPAFHIEIPLAATQGELTWLSRAPALSNHVLVQEAEESTEREGGIEAELARRSSLRAKSSFARRSPGAAVRKPSPPSRGGRPRHPFRPHSWLLGGAAPVPPSAGPDCTLAGERVGHLGELLSHLASTDPARAAELTAAARHDAEGLIKLVPFFVSNGCSRCHLAKLQAEVAGFAWPKEGALASLRARVLELLEAAQGRAPDSGKCG